MNPEDQELQKLEQHLRQLTPAEPSEALTSRIFAAFETPLDAAPPAVENVTPMPEAPASSWAQPFAAAAAVALIAGVVALVGLNRSGKEVAEIQDPPPPPFQPVKFIPAHAQNTYRGSNIAGIVYTDDRRPMQAVRHQFTDTYTWENPADGSRVEVRVPVERIRYVPIATD